MFQFHQNNSQLLFHIIVSLWGAGAFSRDFTTNLARRCRAFTRDLKNEKLKAPPFPWPEGAGDTNDWCITLHRFKTFTVIGNVIVYYIFRETVSILFCFNKAFPPNRSQKVMRLHCRHQPLHHLEEEASFFPGVAVG